MLAGAGIFVHTRLRADLDERVDDALVARAETSLPGGDEEGLTQLLAQDGRLLAGPGARVLGRAELAQAASGPLWTERRRIAGVEGHARVHARPSRSGIVVVAQSLDDRDEALGSVVQSFAFGGLVAVLLVSLVGYGLARAGLRPVEAMRRRAGEIAIDRDTDAALPLPAAHDEIRRLGETLNDMLARLQTAYERERHFVADASHELRTPLTSIRGFAELYRQGAVRGDDDVRRLMERIESEGGRMGLLVEDLLPLARMDQQRPLVVKPVDLAAVAGDAVHDARAVQPDRPISLHLDDSLTDVPVLLGDEGRLRQIVGNLVTNALVHTSAGARITVSLGEEDDGVLVLRVADEGPGMDASDAARAFERFYRADASRNRAAGGTGLGLSIVDSLAAAHGGSVHLDTALGQGTTVTVRLPRSGPPEPPAADGGDAEPG
jgi:signal transduction histidine kinase